MKNFIIIALLLIVQQFIACGNSEKSTNNPLHQNDSTTENKLSKDNIPPVAISRTIYTLENSSVKIQLFGFDEKYKKLTTKILSQPMHGSYNNNLYTPDRDYSGVDSFNFIVNNDYTDSSLGTITIMIKKEENLLDTSKEIIVSKEHSKKIILGNESYTYALLSKPKNGKLSGPIPYITYRPNKGFIGSDSFTYLVGDNLKQTVHLNIKEFKMISSITQINNEIEKSLATYDKYGNLLTKDFISNAGKVYGVGELKKRHKCTCKYLYTYTDKGRVLTKTKYHIDKNLSVTTSDSEIRSYDTDDKLISKNETKNIRGTNYSIFTTYTSKGEIHTQRIFNNDTNYEKSTTIFTYDQDGRLINKTAKTATGKVISAYTYTYDANGNPLTKHPHIYTYDVNGNILTDGYARWDEIEALYSYTYDQYNNILTSTYYNSPSIHRINFIKTYTYDLQGNRIKEHKRSEYDNKDTYYTYKYDEIGNITTIHEAPYNYLTYKSYDTYGNIETIIDIKNGSVVFYHKYQWEKFDDEP